MTDSSYEVCFEFETDKYSPIIWTIKALYDYVSVFQTRTNIDFNSSKDADDKLLLIYSDTYKEYSSIKIAIQEFKKNCTSACIGCCIKSVAFVGNALLITRKRHEHKGIVIISGKQKVQLSFVNVAITFVFTTALLYNNNLFTKNSLCISGIVGIFVTAAKAYIDKLISTIDTSQTAIIRYLTNQGIISFEKTSRHIYKISVCV